MGSDSVGSRSFAIITDAAALGDDGVAVSMLLTERSIDIKLIVCASGNVWAEDVAVNIHGLLTRLNRTDVPVVVGLPSSAHLPRLAAFSIQSQRTKVSYRGALAGPPPRRAVTSRNGYEDLAAVIRNTEGLNLFISGPASPVAAVFQQAPSLAGKVGKVFMMGGAYHVPGNATNDAEFNFWFDAAAADVLLGASLDLTLLPLDATEGLLYPKGIVEALPPKRAGAVYLKDYLIARKERTKKPWHIWDEALSAVVIDSGLIEDCSIARFRVVTEGQEYGKLMVSAAAERGPVKVVTRLNANSLASLIVKTLSR